MSVRRWGAIALVALPVAAHATNGMNMEAFGARAGGLGGAAMAYDSGNSAVMNNPATLALRQDGAVFGMGITRLGPDVASHVDAMGMTAQSGGTAYWMPSLSYIRTDRGWSYGVAILAQGGMGTEYAANSFLSLSGLPVRSEVSFARAMFPLAKKVTDQLALAAQVDFVWAGLDMQMDMSAAQMAAGMNAGQLRASGSMAGMLGTMPANGFARFDLSDGNDFKQQTRGHGWAYKLGVHYQITPQWAIGAAFHSKTRLKDFSGNGTLGMGAVPPGAMQGALGMALPGHYTIQNFEWPTTWAVGVSYQPNERWMFVSDVKRLKWSETMDVFRVRFASARGGSQRRYGPEVGRPDGLYGRGGVSAASWVGAALWLQLWQEPNLSALPQPTLPGYCRAALHGGAWRAGEQTGFGCRGTCDCAAGDPDSTRCADDGHSRCAHHPFPVHRAAELEPPFLKGSGLDLRNAGKGA